MEPSLPNETHIRTSAVTSSVYTDCVCARFPPTELYWAGGSWGRSRQRVNTMCDCWKHMDVLIGRSHSLAAREKGGCLAVVLTYVRIYSLTPDYTHTHKHPHTLFLDVEVVRNVWKGVSGRCLAHRNWPWNGNGAVWWSQRVCVSNGRVLPFLPSCSVDMTPSPASSFDVFRGFEQQVER